MSLSTLTRGIRSLLLAFVLPLVSLEIKSFLDLYIGHPGPFLLFFVAILGAAWQGGLLCGLVASVFSGWLAATFFIEPSFATGSAQWTQVGFFIAEGAIISIVTARCREVQESLDLRARRQSALAQISGVALSQTDNLDHICQRAGEISAQTLHIASVTVWQNEEDALALPEDDFFQSVLNKGDTLKIEDFEKSSLFLDPKWRGAAGAALATPIGDQGQYFGVLLALDEKPNSWEQAETEFISAVASILAIAAQRTRAQTLQREEEARYRTFVEQSSEAIWCCEFQPPLDLSRAEAEIIEDAYEYGILTECNDAFAHIYGQENAAQMLGAPLDELMASDEESNLETLRAFFRSGGRLSNAESVRTDAQGQTRFLSGNLVGNIEDGRMPRMWGTQRDVSAQHQAIAQLRASEGRFRALFDEAPVAIAISRGERLLYVNRASVELLGCQSADEMIGHPVNEFVAAPDRETMQKRIERRAAGYDEPLVYETISLRRDGTTCPFRIEIAALELPDGPATLAFAFDLTQEKEAQAQQLLLRDREQRATRRAERLQEITAALAATSILSLDEVGRIIITMGVQALEANSGALSEPRRDSAGEHMRMIASVGYSDEILRDYGRLPMDESLPVVRAYRENRPFWVETPEEAISAHPLFAEVLPKTGTKALCALPLEVDGRVIGVLSLSFQKVQHFDDETHAFMLTLASQCAQALDRVRLLGEARDAARMQKESLALLNTLLDSAPVGIAFYDLQGRHVLANEALSRIDGEPVAEHLGRTPSEVSPLIYGDIEGVVAEVIRTGEPVSEMEYSGPSQTDSDEIRHFLLSFYPVRVGDGEISGVGAMIVDITTRTRDERERVQLMGELEIERARFEAILQQMPSAVMIAEAPSGKLILGNAQVETILGAPHVESASIAEYGQYSGFHADGRELEPSEWPLARAILNGQTVRGEQIVISRGDSMGIIRANAAPIRDRDGQITAGILIFDDVTQNARINNAQRFLAEAGSALISTLNENQIYEGLAKLCVPRIADWCIVVVPGNDEEAHVSIFNADPDKFGAAQNIKGQLERSPRLPWGSALRGRKAVLYSKDSIESLHRLDANGDYARIMEVMDARSAIIAPLGARGRILGAMIWVTAESGRSYDKADLELADELARRAGLTADSARLYRDAQIARDEAQNANRAKDEFLAVVSHELRTPLTPILGWLELLRTPGANDEMRTQAYSVIERNALAQAQLVNDILDVSRITTGKLRLEMKPVKLAPLVKNAVQSQRPLADGKGIELELAVDEVGEIFGDGNRIQQVVWNLLQNAIKFTPEGGKIRIILRQEGEAAILQVSDSGSGIDPDFLPYVFDRFRQADSSSTRKAGGLGLGLAIVSHIVEAHSGQARAESAGLNQGSTFTIELPLMQMPKILEPPGTAPPTMNNSPLPAPGVLDGISVMITDDEPDTREMMKVLLRSHGANVRTAASARETLEQVQNEVPDLLLSDIGMPFVDGYELRHELALLGYAMPSIALTAYTAPADAQRALDAGFNAHLPKPVDADTLLKLIVKLAKPPLETS